jgi:hypothetical protein
MIYLRVGAVAFVFAVLVAVPSGAGAYTWGWSASPTGSKDLPFDWDEQHPTSGALLRCVSPPDAISDDGADYVDLTTRAFAYKDSDGVRRVQLNYPTQTRNRRMLGDTLTIGASQNVRRESVWNKLGFTRYRPCGGGFDLNGDVVFRAGGGAPNPDPNEPTYKRFEWLASPYLEYDPATGKQMVYALVHNEHKPATGAPCTPPDPPDPTWVAVEHCWLGSINLARSDPSYVSGWKDNVGARYEHPTGPNGDARDWLVATSPYKYCDGVGRIGFGEFTNVIKRWENGQPAYYFMSGVHGPDPGKQCGSDPPNVQPDGVCLFRGTDLSDPHTWTGWDGSGFNRTFPSPYLESGVDPTEHFCTPQTPGLGAPRLIAYNRYLRKYMLIFGSVQYALSDDLLNWSDPQGILVGAEGPPGCETAPVYPTIIDPTDPASLSDPAMPDNNPNAPNNPNYDHPGKNAQLWFKGKNYVYNSSSGKCEAAPVDGAGVDVARIPFTFNQKQVTFESGNLTGDDRGYDTTPASANGSVTLQADSNYGPDGVNRYARASVSGTGSKWAYGRVFVNWNENDDVWYGTALRIPDIFASSASTADIIGWQSGGGQMGVALKANDKYSLTKIGFGGARTWLGSEFDLPTRRWVWVEVHQRLSTTDPVNEVYVDGRLVSSTAAVNTDGSAVTSIRYGLVSVGATTLPLSIDVDRSSIMGGPNGAYADPNGVRAPSTPLSLRQVFSTSNLIGMTWNPGWNSTSTTGSRIYERQADGTWVKKGDVPPNSAFIDTVPSASCASHFYRVTAYRSFTEGLTPPNPAGTNEIESIASPVVEMKTAGC